MIVYESRKGGVENVLGIYDQLTSSLGIEDSRFKDKVEKLLRRGRVKKASDLITKHIGPGVRKAVIAEMTGQVQNSIGATELSTELSIRIEALNTLCKKERGRSCRTLSLIAGGISLAAALIVTLLVTLGVS